MYEYNTKYSVGGGNDDNWISMTDYEAEQMLCQIEAHAKEKGFDIKSYMEFVSESVLRKVG